MAVELSIINGKNNISNFVADYDFQDFFIKNINLFSNDMIIVLDYKKQIISYSDKFSNLFDNDNLTGENFINKVKGIIQLPDDFFDEKSYFVKVKDKIHERVLESKIIKHFNNSNIIDRYIIILKDITEQKEIQAQKDNFIATLTHDLKTPVRANILSLELLLKNRFGKLTQEQNEIIAEILNSNKFMMSMLDTLLAKYKYENEQVELNKTTFLLNEFIKNCTGDFKCLFDEKNVIYTLNLDMDINISADKLELKRAISNILSNAITFNNANGSVIISTCIKNDFIQIEIEDTGIGMSKEKLTHIFDKYVSYAKKFRRLGTGLGLYVAKKIIEAHKGKIEVASTPKKGSVFTIYLPKSCIVI
ncbi:MAG: HAMP domain-containing histidine kinase [Candidatus Gastranaerophilales bacterium]|nr:HAMP domain-containing histidine kinase [Candidatus Gastranaerophilales bacterium]